MRKVLSKIVADDVLFYFFFFFFIIFYNFITFIILSEKQKTAFHVNRPPTKLIIHKKCQVLFSLKPPKKKKADTNCRLLQL